MTLYNLLLQSKHSMNSNVSSDIFVWSLFNIFILVGVIVISFTIAFKLIKYLNLKIKLMQRELDNY